MYIGHRQAGFQFPHTRETLTPPPMYSANSFSIPAHTGNISTVMWHVAWSLFNSRTHGKHRRQWRRPRFRNFNSRTHGKHWCMSARKRIGFFNSRTHGKHSMPSEALRSCCFQFPHTRETFRIRLSDCNVVHFNSRTHGKHTDFGPRT